MAGLFTAIGSNISARLDQLRLSQTDLAEKIGVSKQVVNKIVQGKKAINAVELASIAAVLQCTVDELIQNAQVNRVYKHTKAEGTMLCCSKFPERFIERNLSPNVVS